MSNAPMSPEARNLRRLSRLSRLMIVLTLMLACVLALYGWPILHNWIVTPLATPRPITPRGELMDIEKTTIALFKQASPSVAFITTDTQRLNPFSRHIDEVPQGSGSGFIWDEQGHVVTNYHVIQHASAAHVILYDQTFYDAKVVGYSADHDLAVLKITVPVSLRLVPLPLGTSHDLQVGQSVLAIGNPFGLDQTLTTGVISALKRTIDGENGRPIDDVIQIDAAINPGNSGGPLLDSAGRLIGVNTAIYSSSGAWSGIGFSIPVDTANRVIPEIIRTGGYARARLGIHYDDAATENLLAEQHLKGIAVISVQPDSPADLAGLIGVKQILGGKILLGDVLVALNNRKITSGRDLVGIMNDFGPGDDLTLKIWRKGATREVHVKAAK